MILTLKNQIKLIYINIILYVYIPCYPVLNLLAIGLLFLIVVLVPSFYNICFITLQCLEFILDNVLGTPLYIDLNDYSLHMEAGLNDYSLHMEAGGSSGEGSSGEGSSGERSSGEGSSGNRAIVSQPSSGYTELISQPSPSRLKKLSFCPTLPKIIEDPNPPLILDFGNCTFREIVQEKANYIVAKLELEKFPREEWFDPNLEEQATFKEKDILRAWDAITFYKESSLRSLARILVKNENDPLSVSLGEYLNAGAKKYFDFKNQMLFTLDTNYMYEVAMKYLKTEKIIDKIVKDCFK